MSERRDRDDSGYQNEPLMPDAPSPEPSGEGIEQAARLGRDDEAPLLDVSRYPDATGDIVETDYPEQDSTIDATSEQSRAGGDWHGAYVNPGREDQRGSGGEAGTTDTVDE